MGERQSNLASLGSDSAVEVTTFEKVAGAHEDENAQSFYSKKSLYGKHFLFCWGNCEGDSASGHQLIGAGD